MKHFPPKIAILGVGLIGGSIALGFKKHFGAKITILGSCSKIERAQKAKKLRIIDEVIDPHSQPLGLRSANLIILATPVLEIIKLLKTLSKINLADSLIIDVGSTKEYIINAAHQFLDPNVSFIGTHPMAGSEFTGFENADPNLFRNKPWIVCEGKTINNQQLTIAKRLIDILGANMIFTNAKKHDEIASWASHLNLVSASLLISTIAKQNNWKDVAQIASTGFRDTTRLASSDTEMKKDIILTNKENIVEALLCLADEIKLFVNLIQNGNAEALTNYLANAKSIRDNWLTNYFN